MSVLNTPITSHFLQDKALDLSLASGSKDWLLSGLLRVHLCVAAVDTCLHPTPFLCLYSCSHPFSPLFAWSTSPIHQVQLRLTFPVLSVHQDLFLAKMTVDYHIHTIASLFPPCPQEFLRHTSVCFLPALLLIQSLHILSHCLLFCIYFLPQLVINEDNGCVALM